MKTTIRRTPLIHGTSLKGYMSCTYNEIVSVFGAPDKYNDPIDTTDKVNIEWCLKFPDGTVATIYSWKRVPHDPDDFFEWHIGGHTVDAVIRVEQTLYNGGVKNVLVRTY